MMFTSAAALSDKCREVRNKSLYALKSWLVATSGKVCFLSGIVFVFVLLATAKRHREQHNEYTVAGRKLTRRSTGRFLLYNLLVKCQFKECGTAGLSEHRVHMTFLY